MRFDDRACHGTLFSKACDLSLLALKICYEGAVGQRISSGRRFEDQMLKNAGPGICAQSSSVTRTLKLARFVRIYVIFQKLLHQPLCLSFLLPTVKLFPISIH